MARELPKSLTLLLRTQSRGEDAMLLQELAGRVSIDLNAVLAAVRLCEQRLPVGEVGAVALATLREAVRGICDANAVLGPGDLSKTEDLGERLRALCAALERRCSHEVAVSLDTQELIVDKEVARLLAMAVYRVLLRMVAHIRPGAAIRIHVRDDGLLTIIDIARNLRSSFRSRVRRDPGRVVRTIVDHLCGEVRISDRGETTAVMLIFPSFAPSGVPPFD